MCSLGPLSQLGQELITGLVEVGATQHRAPFPSQCTHLFTAVNVSSQCLSASPHAPCPRARGPQPVTADLGLQRMPPVPAEQAPGNTASQSSPGRSGCVLHRNHAPDSPGSSPQGPSSESPSITCTRMPSSGSTSREPTELGSKGYHNQFPKRRNHNRKHSFSHMFPRPQ